MKVTKHEVSGMKYDGETFEMEKISVIFISDDSVHGMCIVDENGCMLFIPFESV